MVWLSFAQGVGLCYLVGLHVGLYVGSGLWLFLDALWARFIWLVCLLAHVGLLYRADAPSPML